MAIEAYDGAAWRTMSEVKVYDGAVWRTVTQAWVYDGGTWREIWPACSTASLNAVDATITQDGECDEGLEECTSRMEVRVSWYYATCDDSCHHVEVWHKRSASSACTTVSYTKLADNVSCDNDPLGCTPVSPYQGCWLHDTLDDFWDAGSGYTVYLCYEVRLVRDSDEGTDDSDSDYEDPPTLDCDFECGGPA